MGMNKLEYPVVVEPLLAEEGGGFVATVPDLPGCMSDGATPEEALANVQDAIAIWIEAANDLARGAETVSPIGFNRLTITRRRAAPSSLSSDRPRARMPR